MQALVHTGRAAAYKRRNAQLLLWVDQGEAGSALPDREAAERAGVTVRTVENVRRRCVLEGLDRVLQRRPRSRERSRALDGAAEAQLLAIACSEPPEGCARWTLHLLVDELKRRRIVVSVSHETVRQVLKKRRQTLAADHVVHPAEARRRLRVRDGAGPSRVRRLVEEDFPEAERITLAMDNLNTHAGASLYKAFPAPKARRLLEKLQFVYTPKHGSWLNMAECEFSVLARQCLNRRLADMDTVKEEVTAWAKRRNGHGTPAQWRFTTEDARIKLHSLYPKLSH